MSNKITAIYIRTSTSKQSKGLQSQKQSCLEYCKNHHLDNYKIYSDSAISGAVTTRKGFNNLQKDIFNGKINTLVVWELSRLSRNLKDGIIFLTDCLEKNIRIISLKEQLDFNGSMGKLLLSVLLSLSEMEKESIRERVIRGQSAAKQKGVKLGRPSAKLPINKIAAQRAAGTPVIKLAANYGVTRQTIYNCLSQGARGAI